MPVVRATFPLGIKDKDVCPSYQRGREGGSEREREREGGRQTDRQTGRERDEREKDRVTENE